MQKKFTEKGNLNMFAYTGHWMLFVSYGSLVTLLLEQSYCK